MRLGRVESVSIEAMTAAEGRDPGEAAAEQRTMRVIHGCAAGPWPLDVAVIGPPRAREAAVRACKGLPFRLAALSGLTEGEGWLTAHHADLVLVDESVLKDRPQERLAQLRGSVFHITPVICILGDGPVGRGCRCQPGVYAYVFAYDEADELSAFIHCTADALTADRSRFRLSGSLPAGGVRIVISLLEAAQHSGRLVVRPRDPACDQIVLWVMRGEPKAAYSRGARHADPMSQIAEVSEGWFSFVESEVDHDRLRMVDLWSRAEDRPKGDAGPACGQSKGLRQRLLAAIASADDIGEIRDAVQSVLDAGIDKAAEEGDTAAMDSLADVSILLQKNRIKEASALLARLLK